MFPAGTAEESGFGRPDFGKSLAGRNASCQAVTPVCEGKARYFFGVGTSRDHSDEARRDLTVSMVMQAFAEDRAMIEAQYKSICRTNSTFVPSAQDWGITQYRRLCEKIARESRQ